MSSIKFVLLFLIILACSCGNKSTPEVVSPKGSERTGPKNIILMIGDGMGLAQITAAMYKNGNEINMEEFPVIGLQKTHSGDNLVTDSAAAATAIACGVKTFNNGIGVDMDTLPVQSILEMAEERGLATGMIATSSIVHGTPGPFIAHQPSRVLLERIAADFMNTEIDFFVGGGKKFFDRRESDDRDLYKELRKRNYYVSDYYVMDFNFVRPRRNKNFAFFTADDRPLPRSRGREYLPRATKMATDFLSERSDKGFFLMVEGSQIDWGGHNRKADIVIDELLDFNEAVGHALKFAKKNKETLIIITADHETAGFAINNGSTEEELLIEFTANGHTADMIPVFAFGPKSELFSGVYDNTDINKKMRKALGFDERANN